jgi:G3E family GTPase
MTVRPAGERVPVSLVTGFLGSGKTTLIASLLRQPAMDGTAVVVNEFGEVGIDDAILAHATDAANVRLLANGCLCCTAGDDLAATLWSLVRRFDIRPRRIVIETTGLADPASALRRLIGDPRLNSSTRLDTVVATIDAVNGERNLDDQPITVRQAAVADRRLVTKGDIAGPAAVAALRRRLEILNPGASVLEVEHGRIPADNLFGASLFDPAGRADPERWLALPAHRAAARDHGHDHGKHDAAGTWLIEEERPLEWGALYPKLGRIVERHGGLLLRVKGLIRTTDDPRPLVMHGVQRLFHPPVRLERWTGPPRTSIVVIGDRDAEEAVSLIEAALAEAAEAPAREAQFA